MSAQPPLPQHPRTPGLLTRRALLGMLAAAGCGACGACHSRAGEAADPPPPKDSSPAKGTDPASPTQPSKEGRQEDRARGKQREDRVESAKDRSRQPAREEGAASRKKVKNLLSLRNGHACEIEAPHCFLVRSHLGLAALKPVCTHKHQELMLNADGTEIHCPLHSSQFSLSGAPIGGPARRSLLWYLVEVDEAGDVFVDPRRQVAQDSWAPLPAWARPKAAANAAPPEAAKPQARE